jgi:ribosomal protein S27AE
VLNALENASKNNTIDDDSISFDWFGSTSTPVQAPVQEQVQEDTLQSRTDQEDAEEEHVSPIANTPIVSRDVLLEKYLQRINPAYTKKTSSALDDELGTCPECGKEMIFAINEAMLYCPCCNYNEFILIDSDRPSYKDPPRESCYYAYKRINHFNELLAQFQAKENTGIDETTFGLIEAEIKKQRITDLTKLTNVRLREILKKLKLNRLYDHTNYILNRLNGTNAAIIDRDTEEKLRHMFKEIQPAFQKHIPKDRSNFLAYPYVLYKFCELLEMDHFLKNFQLLKNRDKLYDQDTIWKKICEEMRWQFIPTV